MRERRVLRSVLPIALIVAGCAGFRAPVKEEKPAKIDLEVVSTLRSGHTRLMLTDDDLASLRALLKTDPELQGLVDKLVA